MKQNRLGLTLFFAVMVVTAIVTAHANAASTANGSLQLQSLTITPAQGSIVFSPTASSFASAQNSLGEFDDSFSSGTIATSSAAVTWANAVSMADSVALTGAVTANSQIPAGVIGASNAFAFGVLNDFSFSVTGTTGPVAVQFSAILPYVQMLLTDDYGTAGSGLSFLLSIDGAAVLNSQSAYSIGPDSVLFASGTWNLNNSVNLNANQTYSVEVMALAVSTANTTPEPATLWLCLGGVSPFVVRRLRSIWA